MPLPIIEIKTFSNCREYKYNINNLKRRKALFKCIKGWQKKANEEPQKTTDWFLSIKQQIQTVNINSLDLLSQKHLRELSEKVDESIAMIKNSLDLQQQLATAIFTNASSKSDCF